MKYLNEFRDPHLVQILSQQIKKTTSKPWKIMEICGGQTHSIAKYGLFDLLPTQIELVHGPGCPVCVTPKAILDLAVEIAKQKNVILCSFGDMLRVPGSYADLLQTKAMGGNIRMIYSPLDALKLATQHPEYDIVLLAVGFETTAPAHAMTVKQAYDLKLKNFSCLTSIVLVPPAMDYILSSQSNLVQGFLAAGHVCTIMGDSAYHPLTQKYRVPIIITGFEPIDILQGIAACVSQLEQGLAYVDNQYARSVKAMGNPHAQALLEEIFEITSQPWRGMGVISNSALRLQSKYHAFDAQIRFEKLTIKPTQENRYCISGQILQGHKKPHECNAFGKQCTPDTPLGAPMVSTEGACAAYYRYRRNKDALPCPD